MLAMEGEKDKYAHMLSGGNQRKLSVSLAMLGRPSCAFFDEPSVGLDPENRRRLWNVLRKLLEDSKGSLVLSTHRMDEAETVCSVLGIIICGQLFACGTPAALKRAYGKGYRIYVGSEHISDRMRNNTIVVDYLKGKYGADKVKFTKHELGEHGEIDVLWEVAVDRGGECCVQRAAEEDGGQGGDHAQESGTYFRKAVADSGKQRSA